MRAKSSKQRCPALCMTLTLLKILTDVPIKKELYQNFMLKLLNNSLSILSNLVHQLSNLVHQAINFIRDSGYPYQDLSDDMSLVMVLYEHFEI